MVHKRVYPPFSLTEYSLVQFTRLFEGRPFWYNSQLERNNEEGEEVGSAETFRGDAKEE